jgi:hypothetical protein
MTAASQQLQHFQKQHTEREGRMLTKAALTMPQVAFIRWFFITWSPHVPQWSPYDTHMYITWLLSGRLCDHHIHVVIITRWSSHGHHMAILCGLLPGHHVVKCELCGNHLDITWSPRGHYVLNCSISHHPRGHHIYSPHIIITLSSHIITTRSLSIITIWTSHIFVTWSPHIITTWSLHSITKWCPLVLPTLRYFTIETLRFYAFVKKKNLTNVYFSL